MATLRGSTYRRVDIGEVDRELARLERGPGAEGWLRYEMVMADLFARTQAAVHVITGSLRATGKVTTREVGNVWRGTIRYGGAYNPNLPPPSPGPPRPVVDYAIYERRRGVSGPKGNHDFMAPYAGVDRQFILAMMSWYEG